MFDSSMLPDVAVSVHKAAPHVAHHVQAVKPVIMQGYSMISMLISSTVSAGIGFGLGWYIKGRGMAGVQIDLNNIKTDVENLKAKIFPVAAPVAA